MKSPRMVPFLLLVLLVLPLLLSLNAPLFAQHYANNGTIEGEVRDAQGKPLAGLTIEIIRSDVKGRWEVKTDKKGYYYCTGLPMGNRPRYRVRALRDRKLLYEFTDVALPFQPFQENVLRVDFNLEELRQEDEAALTADQRQQIEEARKAMAKRKDFQEEFDLGVELMQSPTMEVVCASRCRAQTAADTLCLPCEKQATTGLSQMAYEEAAAAFERAAALDPTQYSVFANLARAYQGANQLDKAVQANQHALQLKPGEAELYAMQGQLYAGSGRPEEARQMVEKGAALNPAKGGKYYFDLGLSFYNAGDLKSAVEPFRKSIELDSQRADAFYFLGMCLFNQADQKQEGGQWTLLFKPGTREAFEQYLALAPNGRFAKEARDTLATIAGSVPSAIPPKE